MNRYLLLLLVIALAGSAVAADTIKVAAAADLNYAMNDLADRFQATTGTKVLLSFGSSGNLFSQIQNGAPFDLFFSADEDYPKKLAAAGVMDTATLRTYAIGHLVLWVPNASALDPQQVADEPFDRAIGCKNIDSQPATCSLWSCCDGRSGTLRTKG